MPEVLNPGNDIARDWIVRTIAANQTVDISGYGLEVLEVFPRDLTGQVFTSMVRDDFAPSFVGDGYIRARSGAKQVGRFRFVRFQASTTAGASTGTITLKVYTRANVAWTDAEAPGVTRTRVLTRNAAGGLVLANGAAQAVLDTYTLPPSAEMNWSEPAGWDQMYWWGYVWGAGAFNVVVASIINPNDVLEPAKPIQIYNSRLVGPSANVLTALGVSAAGGACIDFTSGIAATTTGNVASCRQPIPPGALKLVIENTAGAQQTFFYIIGCCGHL